MVYRGKPSKGCYSCRARRIKCDQLRPGCTQCANVGAACPGYRNTLDLMFRDETPTVQEKARAKTKRSVKKDVAAPAVKVSTGDRTERRPTPSSDSLSSYACGEVSRASPASGVVVPFITYDDQDDWSWSTGFGSDFASPPLPLSRTSPECEAIVPFANTYRQDLYWERDFSPESDLPPPNPTSISVNVEDFALTFFFGTYINGSRWDYLPTLYTTGTKYNTALDLSVKASALSSLAQELQSGDVASRARNYYARALKSTNDALASKTSAVKDETLASILVLSLFESITQTDQSSRTSWEAHIQGAVALLKMRGKKQFETHMGKMLFLHTSDSIRLNCIHQCQAVPDYLRSVHHDGLALLDTKISDTSDMTIRMANLKAKFRRYAMMDPYGILEELYELHEDVSKVLERLPNHVTYKVRRTELPEPNIWKQQYHLYQTHRHMRLWNALRMVQVWLGSAIWRTISYLESSNLSAPAGWNIDLQTFRQTSYDRMIVGANEICYCVPYIIGDVTDVDGVMPSRFASSLNLIWPLSIIAEVHLTPSDMRDYAINQLTRIGERYRIPQATQAAESLQRYEENPTWIHMCSMS